MAIQPIDLQTMYAQIQNVAKEAAFHEQGVKLADSMQQAEIIEQNKEKAQRVNETEENSKASVVNEDGRGTDSGERRKKKDKSPSDTEEEKKPRLKESYLGQHIDITR
ncbi:MAG: hypothetical protein ACTTKL_00565 [Treponema sp.]